MNKNDSLCVNRKLRNRDCDTSLLILAPLMLRTQDATEVYNTIELHYVLVGK